MKALFRLRGLFTVTVIISLFAASFAAESSKIPSTVSGVSFNNVHRIAPGVYRGQNPVGKISELKKLGINTIVAIRPNNEIEREEIQREGSIEFVEIPMRWKTLPSDYTFDNQIKLALSHINMALSHPRKCTVYIHCTYGEDRTGLVFGLYRMLHDGWTRKQAWNEMVSLGYKTGDKGFITAELTKVFHRWAESIEWGEITWNNIVSNF